MDHHIEERKDLALAAFRGFDVDGSGTITSKEMERVTWIGEVETWDNFLKFMLMEAVLIIAVKSENPVIRGFFGTGGIVWYFFLQQS